MGPLLLTTHIDLSRWTEVVLTDASHLELFHDVLEYDVEYRRGYLLGRQNLGELNAHFDRLLDLVDFSLHVRNCNL